MTSLAFHTDPAAFLAAAGGLLAADPVVNTVVTTATHRAAARLAEGVAPPERDWWVVAHDGSGAVCGAAMRTARFPPYPMYLLPMPDEAAVALARALYERGEQVRAVNGALPAADRCATELARLTGGRVASELAMTLHELRVLVPPRPVPGRLVTATGDDAALVARWLAAFAADADEQAGRPAGATAHGVDDEAELGRRIAAGEIRLWADAAGRPVHLTAASPPSFGVARIGPVYTPPAQRGRGWASNAVAEVSRRLLAGGARVCLFTDRANPTSNKVYAALGYRPVVDTANLVVV